MVHPILHRGLQRAGRVRHDVELCMLKICAVNTDARAARALARHTVAFSATLGHYDIVLDPMGFTDAARAIRSAMRRNDIPGMLNAVTDDMVAALTVAGTPDEVRRQLGQFAGLVDTVILCSPFFAVGPEEGKANHQAL